MKLPVLKALSQKLFGLCLAVIGLYTLFIFAYSVLSNDALKALTTFDMLHSAMLAVVISLGGGLLLDCEIRLAEKKGNY